MCGVPRVCSFPPVDFPRSRQIPCSRWRTIWEGVAARRMSRPLRHGRRAGCQQPTPIAVGSGRCLLELTMGQEFEPQNHIPAPAHQKKTATCDIIRRAPQERADAPLSRKIDALSGLVTRRRRPHRRGPCRVLRKQVLLIAAAMPKLRPRVRRCIILGLRDCACGRGFGMDQGGVRLHALTIRLPRCGAIPARRLVSSKRHRSRLHLPVDRAHHVRFRGRRRHAIPHTRASGFGGAEDRCGGGSGNTRGSRRGTRAGDPDPECCVGPAGARCENIKRAPDH